MTHAGHVVGVISGLFWYPDKIVLLEFMLMFFVMLCFWAGYGLVLSGIMLRLFCWNFAYVICDTMPQWAG